MLATCSFPSARNMTRPANVRSRSNHVCHRPPPYVATLTCNHSNKKTCGGFGLGERKCWVDIQSSPKRGVTGETQAPGIHCAHLLRPLSLSPHHNGQLILPKKMALNGT